MIDWVCKRVSYVMRSILSFVFFLPMLMILSVYYCDADKAYVKWGEFWGLEG